MDQRLKKVKEIARKELRKNDLAHRWDHAEMVASLCQIIAAKEGGNLDVLLPAAYIHDVRVRTEEEYGKHVLSGLDKAIAVLREASYTSKEIDVIAKTILKSEHFMDNSSAIEEKILADADRLDSIGARGLVRCLLFSGARNKEFGTLEFDPMDLPELKKIPKPESETVLDHFLEKLLRIKDLMYTKTGFALAKERHEFLVGFLQQYFKESQLKKSADA